jgi:hypothetical protein
MPNPRIVLFLVLVSCTSIRVVTETKTGGEIALGGARESAMTKAREEMARACGGERAYEITDEGEIGYGGAPVPAGTDPHEWHVHFTCNSAANSAGNDASVAPAVAPVAPADAGAD